MLITFCFRQLSIRTHLDVKRLSKGLLVESATYLNILKLLKVQRQMQVVESELLSFLL